MSPAAAIVGVGLVAASEVDTPSRLGAAAVRAAVDDAGLKVHDITGLLTNGRSAVPGRAPGIGLPMQRTLQLRDLSMLFEVQLDDASASAMVQYAAMAIQAGMAEVVACVFADVAVPGVSYIEDTLSGLSMRDLACAARAKKYHSEYGLEEDTLGVVAVTAHQWAGMSSPLGAISDLTVDEHRASSLAAAPLRLSDLSRMDAGGACVIVASAARARDLARPPVWVSGWSQSHAPSRETGQSSATAALRMAGLTIDDVTIAQLSDPSTISVLTALEHYALCPPGAASELVASGGLGPDSARPVNTGGGQLAGMDLGDMTALTEAVWQTRGQAAERQVVSHGVVLVGASSGDETSRANLVLTEEPIQS